MAFKCVCLGDSSFTYICLCVWREREFSKSVLKFRARDRRSRLSCFRSRKRPQRGLRWLLAVFGLIALFKLLASLTGDRPANPLNSRLHCCRACPLHPPRACPLLFPHPSRDCPRPDPLLPVCHRGWPTSPPLLLESQIQVVVLHPTVLLCIVPSIILIV